MKKITEEGLQSCPVCNVDLGCAPLQRLRADCRWQSIMNNLNETRVEHGRVIEKTKISEVSRQEMKGFDFVPSIPLPIQSKERALYPLANTQIPEASEQLVTRARNKSITKAFSSHKSISVVEVDQTNSSCTRTSLRNEKEKYPADGLSSQQYVHKSIINHREKPLEKMSDLWRSLMGSDNATICTMSYPMEHVQGQGAKSFAANIEDVALTPTLQQSREKRTRPREEKVSVVASGGFKNPTKVTADDNNIKYNEKIKTFWFSLVVSNNQKSRAPLEQIPSRYLRVKDGNITVSSIKKYLKQKLNLRSENEVEISLQGRRLLPTLQVCKLIDLWLQTTAPPERKRAFVGCSAEDFVLTLTYGRRALST
ncbi:hypothetical protein Pfo_016780 [Paulownia fortunei]|nr:hypothetical protein Pfo_016780 [Paulownia fortunei]